MTLTSTTPRALTRSRIAATAIVAACALASVSSMSVAHADPVGAEPEDGPSAGEPGGAGLAIFASKALIAELEGPQTIDRALLLVRDGRIEAIGPRAKLEVPEGYEVLDVGDRWIAPGLVELHCHVAGQMDINDTVYQVNSGLRVTPTVIPSNRPFERAVAAGVTTVLYIPGSGTNLGGQGVLIKTIAPTYERGLVRDPGSVKVAQGDNPTRWGYRMGRVLMNFHLRTVFRQGRRYYEEWKAYEDGKGPKPERDLRLDIFRDLYARTVQVSTHTQYYQLVMMSILMLARSSTASDAFIDHGSFDSYLTSELAERAQRRPPMLGPREVLVAFVRRGTTRTARCTAPRGASNSAVTPSIGFNTDAPVVPQEELPLQAAMGMRYGLRRIGKMAGRAGRDDRARGRLAGIDGPRRESWSPARTPTSSSSVATPPTRAASVEMVFVEGVKRLRRPGGAASGDALLPFVHAGARPSVSAGRVAQNALDDVTAMRRREGPHDERLGRWTSTTPGW